MKKIPSHKVISPEERKKLVEEPGKNWKQWAREDLARYWYVLFCMFVNLLPNLQFDEAYSRYGGTENMILVLVSGIAVVPLIYIEYLIYKKLFPSL